MQSFRIPPPTAAQIQQVRQDAARGSLAKYDAAFADSFAVAASLASSSSGGGWDPTMCPQVAAGYWWSADRTTGFGTTAFRVVEGNGHASFDLVQATVASQPTRLTEFGATQFRMRKQADANPASHRTAGAVQAGWTGATYVGMWLRLPDASGDITSTGDTFFGHNVSAGNGRIVIFSAVTGGDGISTTLNETGVSAAVSSRNAHVTPFVGGGWHYVEGVFDPALTLGGSLTADRNKAFADLVALTRYVTEAGVAAGATIFNASAAINIACNAATAVTDTTDWATCFYANGIPSLSDRIQLARWNAPTTPPR